MAKRGYRDSTVVLVTGAGRGIGRATAEAFAREGYAVILAEIRRSLGQRVKEELVRSGVPALFLETDVSDPPSVRRTVQSALRRFGRIDCLVNNAGVLRTGALADLSVKDLEWMLEVNLHGPLLFARAVIPVMRRQGSGSIINVASQLGKVGMANYVTYCASKFGVVGLTQALADELSDSGIRVWAVCPGLVDTELARLTGVSARERRNLLRPKTVAGVIADLGTGRRQAKSGAAIDVT